MNAPLRARRPRLGPALFLLAWLAGCAAPELGETEAELALEDLIAGRGSSRLKGLAPLPQRLPVRFRSGDRELAADLYRPPQGAAAGIVLVPGAAPAGKDDARLVALATTLARLRFAVLVPDLPGPRAYKVRAGDVREVADAFVFLLARPELSPGGRAGIAGFSYGAGPVLLAALEADIRDQVRFVVGVGGYHDLREVVRFGTTGYFLTADGRLERRAPHHYAKWVYALSNAELLERPADRRAIERLAWNVLYGGATNESAAISGLAPDAAALQALLVNEDPTRVPGLIEGLPVRLRGQLRALNPAEQDLSRLRARVLLLHGRGDTIIPYAESMRLARALPHARLFLIEGLAHMDMRPDRNDVPVLLEALQALLREREF